MTAVEAILATLALLCTLTWGALGLLQHRTRRGWDRHVDGALQVLATRRPQDGIERRWP